MNPSKTGSRAQLRVDVVIIGAGMAGLSCAYHLRESGREVVILERDQVGHREGSSCGASRMYREMYSDPYLAQMAQEANRRWADLEAQHAVSLRHQHGLLFYGESWEEETIEGSIPGAQRVMDAQGIPYEAVDATHIASRWPIVPRAGFSGLFEPTAGAIRSDRVLTLFAAQIQTQPRMYLCEGEGVTRLTAAPDGGYRVETTAGRIFSASKVVLATGAWTNTLLAPLGLSLQLEIWGLLWGHYAVDSDEADRYPQWFCFQQARGADVGLYYGFPVMSSTQDGRPQIKVGIDWAPDALRADQLTALPRTPPAELVSMLDTFLHTQLRGVHEAVELRLSPYTMTRDVNFVLDELAPGLVVFTGGSGQAFKFAPLIGSLMAELVQDQPPSQNIAPWSAQREAVRR